MDRRHESRERAARRRATAIMWLVALATILAALAAFAIPMVFVD